MDITESAEAALRLAKWDQQKPLTMGEVAAMYQDTVQALRAGLALFEDGYKQGVMDGFSISSEGFNGEWSRRGAYDPERHGLEQPSAVVGTEPDAMLQSLADAMWVALRDKQP